MSLTGLKIFLEFAVVIGAIVLGSRSGGVGLGLWVVKLFF